MLAANGAGEGNDVPAQAMGIIEEEDSMDFSSSVRSQIPNSIHREAFSSYQYSQQHSQRTSKAPSRNFEQYGIVPVNVQHT